jgi:hypothetical protein
MGFSAPTGVSGLSNDFIVAPLGGGDPLTGGDYSGSAVALQVIQGQSCTLMLQASRGAGGGPGLPLDLSFVPCAGFDHALEFTDALGTFGSNTVWQALPEAPHNSGMVAVTNSAPIQFYRVMATRITVRSPPEG